MGEPSAKLPEERATRITEDTFCRVLKEISQAEATASDQRDQEWRALMGMAHDPSRTPLECVNEMMARCGRGMDASEKRGRRETFDKCLAVFDGERNEPQLLRAIRALAEGGGEETFEIHSEPIDRETAEMVKRWSGRGGEKGE
jgi:hypothetical protein